MMRTLSLIIGASVAIAPITASADAQFATAESFYSHGDLVFTTLYATADQEPVDGNYVFNGFAMREDSEEAVPWTVTVPERLDGPAVSAARDVLGARIWQRHAYTFEVGDVVVEKIFYDVEGEEARGSVILTDDPLPIAAWLAIAAASSIIVPIGIYVSQCSRIETKTTIGIDGTAVFETSCDIPR